MRSATRMSRHTAKLEAFDAVAFCLITDSPMSGAGLWLTRVPEHATPGKKETTEVARVEARRTRVRMMDRMRAGVAGCFGSGRSDSRAESWTFPRLGSAVPPATVSLWVSAAARTPGQGLDLRALPY